MTELLLLLGLGLFSKEPEPPPLSAQEVQQQTRELVETANRRPDVERWCIQNPDSIYVVEIEGITITIRCKAWWEWRSKH